jgi:phosphomannomutase
MSKLMLSSSGLRGIVGDHLTADQIDHFVRSFLAWLPEGPIVIGGDTRTSYTAMSNLVASICQLCGRNVILIGQVPTPTVQQMVRFHMAAGGIAVTASHNPEQWNGLKIINASGSFLSSEAFSTFFNMYQHKELADYVDWSEQGTLIQHVTALQDHVSVIGAVLDMAALEKSTLKVLIDVNHGAAAVADPVLFKSLGVHVDYLYNTPDGKFSHAPEPLAENVSELCTRMKRGNYDIGFAQDPDADRLVIVDENGRFIGEDYSLAFCMDYFLATAKKENPSIVVNLSTSNIIQYIATKYGATLYHTRIGEPNVTAKIKETEAIIGGEGNGGVILPEVGWGRDSLTGIVLALLHLQTTGQSVSEIIKAYPSYCMIRDKQPLESKADIQQKLEAVTNHYAKENINCDDGVKVSFKDSWVHIRPSNTEPIIRIFAEAPSKKEATTLVDAIKAL